MAVVCVTCAVERETPLPELCPICDEERQYVPESGQAWRSLDELAASGSRIIVKVEEPNLLSLTVEPKLGIGQSALLVTTPEGSLLWDPTGFVDDAAADRVLAEGPVLAIAASHPHMFGAQLSWSRALGGVPVLVNEKDAGWIGRTGPEIALWSGEHHIAPGLTLIETGGHFPGSAVALWEAGADGRGVLLSSDTIFPNPDRKTVTFMRSLPNRLPLSIAVTERIARQVAELTFDRVYGNVHNIIDRDGAQVIAASAERQIAWMRGDFDQLTD